MYNICICDDDEVVLDNLNKLIQSFSFQRDIDIVVNKLSSAEMLLSESIHFDILFLDIRFSGKDIGIEIGRRIRLRGNDSIIILLTSLQSKSIEGYEIGAFRYLLKPLSREKIYDVLDHSISKLESSEKILTIKSEYGNDIVRINSIIYILTSSRKRVIKTTNDEISTWKSLQELYELLPQRQFRYAQKSYIVNLGQILKIKKTEIIMTDGEVISISRQMRDEFFIAFHKFLGEG